MVLEAETVYHTIYFGDTSHPCRYKSTYIFEWDGLHFDSMSKGIFVWKPCYPKEDMREQQWNWLMLLPGFYGIDFEGMVKRDILELIVDRDYERARSHVL